MKIGKSLPSGSKTEPRGFYDLAKAHVATQGGEWLVIDSKNPAQAQQRRAWLAYFAWLDEQTSPKGKKAATFRMLEKFTVPAEWPLDFDANAPPAPLPEPASPPISPERRKQLADMLRSVVAEHELREQRAPNWRDMTPAQAEDRLAERTATYAKTPPPVNTSDMAKYLEGMRQPEDLDDAIDF
jgi:hypothetical protein